MSVPLHTRLPDLALLLFRLMMYSLTAPSQTGVPWDASRWVPGLPLFERLEDCRHMPTNLTEIDLFILVFYLIPTLDHNVFIHCSLQLISPPSPSILHPFLISICFALPVDDVFSYCS